MVNLFFEFEESGMIFLDIFRSKIILVSKERKVRIDCVIFIFIMWSRKLEPNIVK